MGFETPKFETPETIKEKAKPDYLETHLEPPLPADREPETNENELKRHPESVRRLFNPDVKYEKSGQEKIELKNGWILEYSYEAINQEDIDNYIHKNKQLPDWLKENAGKYRRLTNLTINSPEGNELDLIKDFQPKEIIFATDNNFQNSKAKADKILTSLPPNSFLGIMTIFHELGHVKANQKIISSMKDFTGVKEVFKTITTKKMSRVVMDSPIIHWFLPKKLNEAAGTNVLKDERDAWAVAVRALRGTLNAFGVSNEDFKKAIHDFALTSYSENIRKRI